MKPRPTMPRFPAQPLLDATPGGSIKAKARTLGVDHAQLCRYIVDGLTPWAADRYATAIRSSVWTLWPTEWPASIPDELPAPRRRQTRKVS